MRHGGDWWRGAREAAGSLASVLPAHEVDEVRAHLSEMAVGPGHRQPPGAPSRRGRWMKASEYASYWGVSVQTLANWRWQDRKAGRDGPAPGKPIYRYFGRAVRYLLREEE